MKFSPTMRRRRRTESREEAIAAEQLSAPNGKERSEKKDEAPNNPHPPPLCREKERLV
jgi:hypothetical protein